MDIGNAQLVGVLGEHVVVLAPKRKMSKREAMVHAAWLLSMACGGDFTEWDTILAEVLNS